MQPDRQPVQTFALHTGVQPPNSHRLTACSMSQHCKHYKKCMVYLLTQVSTHSSGTAKAGQTATLLLDCPALLSLHAKGTMSLMQLIPAHSSSANWGHANQLSHVQERINIASARADCSCPHACPIFLGLLLFCSVTESACKEYKAQHQANKAGLQPSHLLCCCCGVSSNVQD